MKPIIGITGNRLAKGIDKFYGHRVTYTQQRYVDAIHKVGGLPIVIPIDDPDSAKQMIGLVDGLLMTGGQDITPFYYGEEPLPEIADYAPIRDAFEIELTKQAFAAKTPILAVCRGMQVVNVALGGSLYQDGKYVEGSLLQHLQQVDEQLGSHLIDIDPGSLLATVHGTRKRVNSLHHQYVKKVASRLHVTARTQDGMIEAVEGNELESFFIGVQWHPELMFQMDRESEDLFALFVKASKKN
ncbi:MULTISPECIES: gamma-glutamyl-gamma-aminobutyrate hydrolase family protein [Listeria]|uniref:gamma-glutamyl-gamma-aminobutyrate hydrolase family protein n=1 Tax=Listeria TaxID=1637 RepID=UPI000B58ED90|nr:MULTISPECIES: gamma-glutamyl-gamma-aminobutyrate hydrolase family protein [Listeria]